jgi:hypothetical protein
MLAATRNASLFPGRIARHSDILALQLLEAAGSGGNLTTNARVAALAIRDAVTVHTADPDDQRIPNVRRHHTIAVKWPLCLWP